ncbi:hypothetical protein MAR_006003 [Mya arenaria]|uniref:Uncharacterized protein n=1 Tax=Mya arenaria TaxID=6604 RepID=A0ABY7D787_MYAAR|nr:hypothetical protein MAR_006003 [Mya arenaria]
MASVYLAKAVIYSYLSKAVRRATCTRIFADQIDFLFVTFFGLNIGILLSVMMLEVNETQVPNTTLQSDQKQGTRSCISLALSVALAIANMILIDDNASYRF